MWRRFQDWHQRGCLLKKSVQISKKRYTQSLFIELIYSGNVTDLYGNEKKKIRELMNRDPRPTHLRPTVTWCQRRDYSDTDEQLLPPKQLSPPDPLLGRSY